MSNKNKPSKPRLSDTNSRAMWFLENRIEQARDKKRSGISLDELQRGYKGFVKAMKHRDAKRTGKAPSVAPKTPGGSQVS